MNFLQLFEVIVGLCISLLSILGFLILGRCVVEFLYSLPDIYHSYQIKKETGQKTISWWHLFRLLSACPDTDILSEKKHEYILGTLDTDFFFCATTDWTRPYSHTERLLRERSLQKIIYTKRWDGGGYLIVPANCQRITKALFRRHGITWHKESVPSLSKLLVVFAFFWE